VITISINLLTYFLMVILKEAESFPLQTR